MNFIYAIRAPSTFWSAPENVHLFPALFPPLHTVTLCYLSMSSAAANFPPELFDIILWFITHDQVGNEAYRGKEQKRVLSLCSLVCRHWARICRPLIFRSIALRSASDLSLFKHTLLTPPPLDLLSLAKYVKNLYVEVKHIEPPWAHRLRSDLAHILSTECQLNLIVDASALEEISTARSVKVIFDTLPRTLPSAHACFFSLEFSSIHFRDTVSLYRLISMCRILQELYLNDLTWDIAPSADVVMPSTTRALSHLNSIMIWSDKGNMLPMLMLPVLTKGRPAGALAQDTYHTLGRLLCFLADESGYTSELSLGKTLDNSGEPR
jgi:hypothetical protein